MPDKPAAIREMRRVLAPGRRVAIATWRSLEDIPGMLELNAVAERHVGRIVDSRHSFGDANALNHLLVDARFSDVSVGTLAHDVQFADGALFARLNAMAVIGMSDKGKAMTEAERGELAGRIAAESQDLIAEATKNGMFVFPLTTNIATARLMTSAHDAERRGKESETPMPFKSQAQRRKFAQLLVEGKISNQTFEEWNRETGGKKLPGSQFPAIALVQTARSGCRPGPRSELDARRDRFPSRFESGVRRA